MLGLTGAQYLCLVLLPTSAWIWFRVRKQLARDIEAGMPVGVESGGTSGSRKQTPRQAERSP